jgi:hypothetical protein
MVSNLHLCFGLNSEGLGYAFSYFGACSLCVCICVSLEVYKQWLFSNSSRGVVVYVFLSSGLVGWLVSLLMIAGYFENLFKIYDFHYQYTHKPSQNTSLEARYEGMICEISLFLCVFRVCYWKVEGYIWGFCPLLHTPFVD